MSTNFANHVAPNKVQGVIVTNQREFTPGREAEQAHNNAGGVSFVIKPIDHVLRFLILGTEGGTYYASEKDHTYQAFEGLKTAISEDARTVVDLIVDVSVKGRAAKNDPALFALAAVMAFAKNPEDKFYARSKLNDVARIGTHLFHFAQFVDLLKGWGTGTRKAFQSWYLDKTPEQLAHQYIKYTQRDGWSHRDLLRKTHPKTEDVKMKAMFDVMTHPDRIKDYQPRLSDLQSGIDYPLPPVMYAAESVKTVKDVKTVVQLIRDYKLPREAIPTEFLNSTEVWEVLLPHMGPEAMIRNLAKLTSLGMLQPMSQWAQFVRDTLTNQEKLSKARIHPLNVYKAFKTYSAGRGVKGSLSWTPSNTVKDALESAFHLSFNFVQPSGKNTLLGLDVSGSMSSSFIPDVPSMTCREACAVMALVTAKVEPNYHTMAFTGGFIPLDITKNDSFDTVQRKMLGLGFERTDCSKPMEYASKHNIPVDIFQIYTDNDTWAGVVKPNEALQLYRKKLNKPRAKLAVVAFTASRFSIADPKDPFMLDFVGFDANAPQAMAELAKM